MAESGQADLMARPPSGALGSPGATTKSGMIDPFGRSITYLRVSVTDRCDLRCFYCMSEDMTFLPKADLLSLEELDRLTRDFIAYYADHIADASRPFEGLESALDDLAGRGYRFAVCTNKLEWLSKRLLDQLGLSARFAAICGADTFGISKPDPAILQQTIARAGGQLSQAIMVGDAGPDIGVARRAGVPVIGVEFGYTDVPIADLKPDRLIGHMRDLPAAVASLTPQSPSS